MEEGFVEAFRRHGADVHVLTDAEEATPEVEGTVFFAATADEAASLIPRIQQQAGPDHPTVVILTDPSLEDRLRFEAIEQVRVLPRTPSVDALAAGTLRRLRRPSAAHYAGAAQPNSDASAPVTEGEEASLDEITELIRSRLRNGILHVSQGDEDVRLVIRDGKPLSNVLEEFVERIRANVSAAEPLHYDFIEALAQDDSLDRHDIDRSLFGQLRFLLLDQDPARADLVAQTLRNAGAEVLVARAEVGALTGAHNLYPDVVLVGADSLAADGLLALRALKSDPCLRWSALVVVHWDDVLETPGTPPSSERIALRLGQVHQRYATLASALETRAAVEHALAQMGPVQLLRFLARHPQGMLVEAVQRRQRIQVAVSEGLLVGATVQRLPENDVVAEGLEALACYVALEGGTVTIQKRARPFKLNLMLEVDQAVADALGPHAPASPIRLGQPVHSAGYQARTLPAPLDSDHESTETSARAFSSSSQQFSTRSGKDLSNVPRPPRLSPTVAPLLQRLRSLPGSPKSGERGRPQSIPNAAPGALRTQRANDDRGRALSDQTPLSGQATRLGRLSIDFEEASEVTPNLSAPSLQEAETTTLKKDVRERAAGLPRPLGEEPTLPAKLDETDTPEPVTRIGSLRAKQPESSTTDAAPDTRAPADAMSASSTTIGFPPDRNKRPEKRDLRLAIALLLLGTVTGLSAWHLMPPGAWLRIVTRAQTLVGMPADAGKRSVLTAKAPPATAPSENSDHASAEVANAPLLAGSSADGLPVATSDAKIEVPPGIAKPSGNTAAPNPKDQPVAERSADTQDARAAEKATAQTSAKRGDDSPTEAREDIEETDARALVLLGQRRAREGDSENAAAAFRKALSIDAKNNRALFGLGELALAAGAHEDALSFLERAVELRPKRAPFRVVYGDALAASGKHKEAKVQWRLAVRLEPGNRDARSRLR